MPEKRQHARKPVNLPASITLLASQAQYPGTCRDLSIGGMFVETQARAAFGDKLSVSLDLPGGPVVMQAVVRWTAPDGLGLQFGLMGARETHAIVTILTGKR